MVWFWVTSVKGSFVSWFNNRSFKMVGVANDYAVETLEPQLSWFHRWFPFLQWSPSSPQDLKIAEEELLSSVKNKSKGKYVEVLLDERTNCKVWTRIFNPGIEDKCPLVMLHGMGAGLALF